MHINSWVFVYFKQFEPEFSIEISEKLRSIGEEMNVHFANPALLELPLSVRNPESAVNEIDQFLQVNKGIELVFIFKPNMMKQEKEVNSLYNLGKKML